jgi:hypothetical protein
MQRAASRYNPTLTFEQYQVLLERKRLAHADGERLKYKDLMKEWGVKQHALATAVQRGIKQYEYRIWKASKNDNRQL